ncbi:hypothetical protein BaRGS_00028164 [Batillaria attramentaria]|uniref:Uncharacterized protein n=1 Tax=Batillaria attramentaria TaxID=370345 RepID=A0ABD0K092_9CAEN
MLTPQIVRAPPCLYHLLYGLILAPLCGACHLLANTILSVSPKRADVLVLSDGEQIVYCEDKHVANPAENAFRDGDLTFSGLVDSGHTWDEEGPEVGSGVDGDEWFRV